MSFALTPTFSNAKHPSRNTRMFLLLVAAFLISFCLSLCACVSEVLQDGDELSSSLNVPLVVLAAVVCFVGSFVATILCKSSLLFQQYAFRVDAEYGAGNTIMFTIIIMR